MSPTLQKEVPLGSLEARIMKYAPPTVSESRSTELIARTYKMQGFTKAADRILGAASRLEEEATKEKQYWDQIIAIKKSFPISKVPRDPRSHGIHFGFRDAAPSFRNRGFAALSRSADGSLQLHQGALPSIPVTVQVSIIRDGTSCGASSIPQSKSNEVAIDEQVLQARNTLYEEELFHELGREARLLANRGAHVSSKQMMIPLDERTQLQIDLVNLKNNKSNDACGSDQQLADGVAISLRILLLHAHEQNLQRRSQPPPLMTLRPKPVPEYALLRPIITHLQHRNRVKSLTAFLQTILQPLSSAGIPSNIEPPEPLHALEPTVMSSSNHKPHTLLSILIKPLTTTLTLHLPTSHPLKIAIHTNPNPPTFGTEYSFSPQTFTHPSISTLTLPYLTDPTEVQTALRHLLNIEIVAYIISSSSPTIPSPSTHAGIDHAAAEKKEQSTAKVVGAQQQQKENRWTLLHTFQHPKSSSSSGSASSSASLSRGRNEKLDLRLWDDRLGLRYLRPADSKTEAGTKDTKAELGLSLKGTAYAWDGSGDAMMEVVDRNGNGNADADADGDGDGDGDGDVDMEGREERIKRRRVERKSLLELIH